MAAAAGVWMCVCTRIFLLIVKTTNKGFDRLEVRDILLQKFITQHLGSSVTLKFL